MQSIIVTILLCLAVGGLLGAVAERRAAADRAAAAVEEIRVSADRR